MTQIHVFELSGLGKAPFRYTAKPPKGGEDKSGVFFCEHCGTILKNRHFIQSADGMVSVVGIDCLNKTGDQGLIDAQKHEARKAKDEQSAQERADKQARARQQFEAKYGMSAEALAEKNEVEINTLTDILVDRFESSRVYTVLLKAGHFGNAMIEQILRLETLSPGMRRTIKEITAKHVSGARKNSKAYKAVYPEIEAEVDALAEQLETTSSRVSELKNDLIYKWRQL